MNTTLDCFPCFVKQALEASRFISDDEDVHEKIMRDILAEISQMDFSTNPPVIGQLIHRKLRELTGVYDPYRQMKDRFNNLSLSLLPDFRDKIKKSDDPFYTATRFAIAGNVIDAGVKTGLTENEVSEDLMRTMEEPFHGNINDFRDRCMKAGSILYLADNAGEIVLDRLLVEQLLLLNPTPKITLAVRGVPVLNDATMKDAEAAGLPDLIDVIQNGSDAPGTVLSDCSEEFQDIFRKADLKISKGQGNYETLSGGYEDVYFLFKAKCSVIAAHAGLKKGTHVAVPAKR